MFYCFLFEGLFMDKNVLSCWGSCRTHQYIEVLVNCSHWFSYFWLLFRWSLDIYRFTKMSTLTNSSLIRFVDLSWDFSPFTVLQTRNNNQLLTSFSGSEDFLSSFPFLALLVTITGSLTTSSCTTVPLSSCPSVWLWYDHIMSSRTSRLRGKALLPAIVSTIAVVISR